jgi:hypothetical protein
VAIVAPAVPFPLAIEQCIIMGEKGASSNMTAISLKAHFDGTSIQLDEPYDLPRDAPLLVTVLASAPAESPLPGWSDLGANSLARAYGSDEPEYSVEDVVP